MSMKFLVDYINQTGWGKGIEDIYLSGQLMAEVLPKFGTDEKSVTVVVPQVFIKSPELPTPIAMTDDGSPAYSRMTVVQIDEYRAAVTRYNYDFVTWCNQPAPDVQLTDRQFDMCQRVCRFFAPRGEEERGKELAKLQANQKARPELPGNEWTYYLLKGLNLSPVS